MFQMLQILQNKIVTITIVFVTYFFRSYKLKCFTIVMFQMPPRKSLSALTPSSTIPRRVPVKDTKVTSWRNNLGETVRCSFAMEKPTQDPGSLGCLMDLENLISFQMILSRENNMRESGKSMCSGEKEQ